VHIIANNIAGAMMVSLADHVSTLEQWSNGRVLTIKGAHETFCSGGHLPFVAATAVPVMGAKMSIFMQVRGDIEH
jgi:enoyl-CoA hydratase/carnithine racemase